MNQVNVPSATLLAELVELVATGNLFDAAKVHLYKTDIALGPTTDLADFVECDFSGYSAAKSVTWGTPFYAPDGTPTVAGGLASWATANPATILNIVYGWYVTDTGSTVYLFGRRFDNPVVLSGPLQGVDVVPSYPAFLPS